MNQINTDGLEFECERDAHRDHTSQKIKATEVCKDKMLKMNVYEGFISSRGAYWGAVLQWFIGV